MALHRINNSSLDSQKLSLSAGEQSQSALRFLARIGEHLFASFDETSMLEVLSRDLVPAIADGCIIYRHDEQGVRPVVVYTDDPRRAAAAQSVAEQLWATGADRNAQGQPAGLTGSQGTRTLAPDRGPRRGATPHRKLLRQYGWAASECQPLLARGRSLGILVLLASTEQAFSAAERALLQEVARQAGLALDTATRYRSEQQAREMAERLAARAEQLQRLTALVSEAMAPEQVGELIVTQVVQMVGASAASIFLANAAGTGFDLLGAAGYSERSLRRIRQLGLHSESPVVDAVRTGEPLWLRSGGRWSDRYPAMVASQSLAGNRSWAVLPLVVDGQSIGGLALSFREAKDFTDPSERDFLLALSQQCAQALQRARLFHSAQQANQQARTYAHRLKILADLSYELGQVGLDLQAALDLASQRIADLTGDYTFITLLSADGRWLELAAHASPSDAVGRETLEREVALLGRECVANGLSAVTMQSLRPFRVGVADPRVSPSLLPMLRELAIDSVLLAPLRVRGRVVGVLTLLRPAVRGRHTEDDEALARDLADRAAMAIDTARLYQEAQRAIAVRDEFLSIAAHELKTPITSLHGFAQLVLRQLDRDGDVSPDALRRAFSVIDQQSGKLARLISQLLDASRIESGQLALNRTRTNLVSLVHAVVAQIQGDSPHPIHVRTPRAMMANVDPMRFEQVLLNLLDNAVKLAPEPCRILIDLAPEGDDWARLTVADSGIGLPQERQAVLFDSLSPAHDAAQYSGLGLGLQICRQIVDLHGGQLAVELPPGGGSRFIVRLPVVSVPTPVGKGGRPR